jgi:hypothetical protein
MAPMAFQTLFHADWSVTGKKRWVTRADRARDTWRVTPPRRVDDTPAFLEVLFGAPGPVLAGFDFPIGMPAAYGRQTGQPNFPAALEVFGHGEWRDIFAVAQTADQISIRRPFYPRASNGGPRKTHLLRGLGLNAPDDLMRRCERATSTRRAACSLFWTIGPNQVGKAAIAGWREIITPARRRGARLWPFDGNLTALAIAGGLVLAETYPAETQGHLGFNFGPRINKRRTEDRRHAMSSLREWAGHRGMMFDPQLIDRVDGGFGFPGDGGDDAFDSLIGALGMIEVVDGRRAEGPDDRARSDVWEGWILGLAP